MISSLYPDGVLVDRSALRRTELTKAAEILRNRTSITSCGIFSGGEVTVNAITSTLIDVDAFSGFTPNGEFVEGAATVGVALEDSIAGVVNYVVAVYTEINDRNQPHESDGSVYPTRARASYRVRTYTETNYTTVLLASDSNLANDSKDRCLILGKVTATGGVLSNSNIVGPVTFSNIMTATPYQGINITGVMILEVSPDTEEGVGTLTYDSSTFKFTWTSVSGAGSAVLVPSDAEVRLCDSVGASILIQVVVSQLPTAGTVTDTITIANLYSQDIPRFTAEDWLHRNYTGTGIVTEHNPHGNSLDDFAGASLGLLDEHQDVMHCNGIWKGSSAGTLGLGITSLPAVADTLTILAPPLGSLYYINGKKLSKLNNNSLQFSVANFNSSLIQSSTTPSSEGAKLYQIFVDDNENFITHLKAEYPVSRNVTGTWVIDCNVDFPAQNAVALTLTVGVSTLTFTFDSGSPVTIPKTAPAGEPDTLAIRLYALSGGNWVDLWVNRASGSGDAFLPTALGDHTDHLKFYASPDLTQHLCVGSVPYWYSTLGRLGYFSDYSTLTGGQTVDKRPWGTIDEDNMSDDFLKEYIYDANNEFHNSGVLLNRGVSSLTGQNFGFVHTSTSRTATIRGGSYYLKGRKRSTSSQEITFPASKTYLTYITNANTITYLDITGDFAGSVQAGLAYLAGSTLDRNDSLQDYVSDNLQNAERGVPLYVVVTDGLDVTSYVDIMRNVNGPVDRWSVANRAEAMAEFDSLEAAFYWADVYTSTTYFDVPLYDVVDIKLVGKSYIANNITQPSRVNVFGIRPEAHSIGSATDAVEVSADSETNPAWTLRERCSVSGVFIKNTYTGVSITAGRMFGINGSSVSISNCYFDSGSEPVAFAMPSANVSNLKLINNEVYSGVGFYGTLPLGPTRTTSVSCFTGNKIRITKDLAFSVVSKNSSTDYGALCFSGYSNTISDNYFLLEEGPHGATNLKSGVVCNGVFSGQNFIKDNFILLGNVGENGIVLLSRLQDSIVSGNTIKHTSIVYAERVGISAVDCFFANSKIINNVISGMWAGISYSAGSTDSYGLQISGNCITGDSVLSSARGIYVSGSSINVEAVSIKDNVITNLIRNDLLTSSPYLTILAGIEVSVGGAGLLSVSNISIENNKISDIHNTKAGNAAAVGVVFAVTETDSSGEIYSLSISGNNISGVQSDNFSQISIYVNMESSNTATLSGSGINNNTVSVLSSSVLGRSSGIAVFSSSNSFYASSVSICSNMVRTVGGFTADYSNGIWTYSLQKSRLLNFDINDNNVSYCSTGISLMAGYSNIVSNNILSLSAGIYGDECSNCYFRNNRIQTHTYKSIDYGDIGYVQGGIVINKPSSALETNNDYVISDCQVSLFGNASDRILSNSANLYTTGDRFSIDGVQTNQFYVDLQSTNAAYHLYVATETLDDIRISIKNCVFDNSTGTPDTQSDHTSHVLFFNATYIDPGHITSGSICVSNNTTYWPKEIVGTSYGWSVAPVSEQGGAKAVRCPYLDMGPTNTHSIVRFVGNSIFILKDTLSLGQTRSPNAYFSDALFYGGAGPNYSNTYSYYYYNVTYGTVMVVQDWGSSTANS